MIHPPLSVYYKPMPKIDDDRVYTKNVAPVLKQSTLKIGEKKVDMKKEIKILKRNACQ